MHGLQHDLERLDDYLSSDDSPAKCMMLSDLDGFLHGVVCCPVTIPTEEWMSFALGGAELETIPRWVLETIADLYMVIAGGLASDPPYVEPMFWEGNDGAVIAMDWCEGFMDAIKLRPKEWLRLSESGTHGHLLTPIMVHMFDDKGQSMMGLEKDQVEQVLDEAAEQIPDTVAAIYEFWRGKL